MKLERPDHAYILQLCFVTCNTFRSYIVVHSSVNSLVLVLYRMFFADNFNVSILTEDSVVNTRVEIIFADY